MASSGSVNSSSYSNWYLQLNWTQTAKNSQTNKSTISWNVKTIRSSGSGSYYVGAITAKINGTTVYSCDNSNRWLMTNGATIASGTTYIEHNNDGTKSFTASIEGAIYTYAVNVSGSKSFTLDTIPRYATISQSLMSRTEESLTVSWTADATCDYLWYSTNGGTSFTAVQIANATSGDYTITGLSVGTTYNIVTKVRRKDSQLSSQTASQAMATYPKPYASNTPNFTLGSKVSVTLFNPLAKGIRVSFLDRYGNVIETESGSINGNAVFFDPNVYDDPTTVSTMVDNLYATIPNATSGRYSIKVEDMYDQADYTVTQGGYYSINSNVCSPKIGSVSYRDTNTTVQAVVEDDSKILQSLSTVRYTASSLQAKKSATIASVSVAVNGNSYALTVSGTSATGGNATINSTSNVNAVFTLTDSRGLTAQKTVEVDMMAWALPTAVISVERVNNFYSTTNMKVDADYSSIDGRNTITITYRGVAVPITGQTTPSDVTGTLQDNVTGQGVFDNNFEWNITFTLTDAFNASSTYHAYISRGMPIAFFDRILRSLSLNSFPEHAESLEVNGDIYADGINANGVIQTQHGNANTNAKVSAKRTDTNTSVWVGVGSAGVNHGVYSDTLGKWMIYGNASDIKVNGTAENVTGTVAIEHGGTGETTLAGVVASLLTKVTEYSNYTTYTSTSYTPSKKTFTAVGSGLVFASVTTYCDNTNSYGSTSALVKKGTTIYARDYERTDTSAGAEVSANTSAMFFVSNGNTFTCESFSSKAGTKYFYWNVVAIGCTLTMA